MYSYFAGRADLSNMGAGGTMVMCISVSLDRWPGFLWALPPAEHGENDKARPPA